MFNEVKKELVKKIIGSSDSICDGLLNVSFSGYEFCVERDPEHDNDWYIQVNPEGEGFLYDGWWPDSRNKSLEEALLEAIDGAGVFNEH